jgi:arsenate reductase
MDAYKDQKFDFVITLCDDADRACPAFMGGQNRVHIGFDNPDKVTGTDSEILDEFRRVRDDIRTKIESFLTGNEEENEPELQMNLF